MHGLSNLHKKTVKRMSARGNAGRAGRAGRGRGRGRGGNKQTQPKRAKRAKLSSMSWRDVLDEWQKGNYPTFNRQKAFRWRCAPVNQAETWLFDCQLEQADLAKTQNPDDFAQYFDNKPTAKAFWNLDHTCLLVCPEPVPGKNFAHLQLFDKHADQQTKQTFWTKVAQTVRYALNTLKFKQVFVSTEGAAVDYLHVRISATPKYYNLSSMTQPVLPSW